MSDASDDDPHRLRREVMRNTMKLSLKIALTCSLLCSALAQAATAIDLMDQGRWMDAANQAEKDGDYLTASLALNLQMQCPSPTQPSGQVWSKPVAQRGAALAKKALTQPGVKKSSAYNELGSHLGLIANSMIYSGDKNFSELMGYTRDSKNAYDKAVNLDANYLNAVANLATFHAKTYKIGGIVFGASRGEAQLLISRSVKMFNQAPNNTPEQQILKGMDAVRIGTAMEGVNDSRSKDIFEAALRLGEAAGGARGKCVANLARVHLNRPITSYY